MVPESQAASKPRIEYVDLAKGICIMLVVFTHILQLYKDLGLKMPLEDTFRAFRMPLYFFLSGLFFKSYGGFGCFALRKFNKLLVPFLFFHLLSFAFYMWVLPSLGIKPPMHMGYKALWAFLTSDRMLPNGPLWFLLCLFWVNLFFFAIHALAHKLCKRDAHKVAFLMGCSFLCAAVGIGFGKAGVSIRAFFDTALTCIPFFSVGYVFRKHTQMLYPARWDCWLPLLIVAAFAAAYAFDGGMFFFANRFGTTTPLHLYVGGVAGTLGVMFLAKAIGRLPVVSLWGRYSVVILGVHYVIIFRLVDAFKHHGWETSLGAWPTALLCFALTMALCTAIMAFCVKYLPWFTAQKDLVKVGNARR